MTLRTRTTPVVHCLSELNACPFAIRGSSLVHFVSAVADLEVVE